MIGAIFRAIILVCALYWIYFVLKKLPQDVARIKEKYNELRTRDLPRARNPSSEKDCERDSSGIARDFLIHLGVTIGFWIVTIVLLIFVCRFVWGLMKPILSYL